MGFPPPLQYAAHWKFLLLPHCWTDSRSPPLRATGFPFIDAALACLPERGIGTPPVLSLEFRLRHIAVEVICRVAALQTPAACSVVGDALERGCLDYWLEGVVYWAVAIRVVDAYGLAHY